MEKKIGRPAGINKSKKVLGYKYTPEEAEIIISVLDDLRAKGMTTSKALLSIFREYRNILDSKGED